MPKDVCEINNIYGMSLGKIAFKVDIDDRVRILSVEEAAGNVVGGSYIGEMILKENCARNGLKNYAETLIKLGEELINIINEYEKRNK